MVRIVRYLTFAVSAFLSFSAANAVPAAGNECTLPQVREMQQDSARFHALGVKLDEYMLAIERESAAVKKEEADFLIESCSDPEIRQYTALRVYDHYTASKVMGDEAVSIHVYDTWFANGRIEMRSSQELMAARIFAEFNRRSLIGEKAPSVSLQSMSGDTLILFDKLPRRLSILYFYDTSCAKCRVESIMLRNILENDNFDADFYAVYVGTDMTAWENYAKENLAIPSSRTSVFHLWDPSAESDLALLYGVVQTPRLFLVDGRGVIVGRGLDAISLERLINMLKPSSEELDYGSEESEKFYDGIFAPIESKMTCSSVPAIAERIASRTLEAGDTTLFRQMTGDLLYYLSGKRGEAYKCGTEEFMDKYILSRSDVWKTGDDSLKVVQMAGFMQELLDLARPGTRVPDIAVHAVLKRYGKKDLTGNFVLGRQHSAKTVLLFHTEGCEHCRKEMAAADSLLALKDNRNMSILLVNVDELAASYPSQLDALFEYFDLSALPYVVMTDRKGVILRRYVSLSEY